MTPDPEQERLFPAITPSDFIDYLKALGLIGDDPPVTYTQTADGWSTITSLSKDPYGGLSALFAFDGVVFIDGINVTGVFHVNSPRY